jgi:hypothetical protein
MLATVPGGAGSGQSISVLGVQRPAESVNYGTIGVTSAAVLAGALAGAAFIALGLTLPPRSGAAGATWPCSRPWASPAAS